MYLYPARANIYMYIHTYAKKSNVCGKLPQPHLSADDFHKINYMYLNSAQNCYLAILIVIQNYNERIMLNMALLKRIFFH